MTYFGHYRDISIQKHLVYVGTAVRDVELEEHLGKDYFGVNIVWIDGNQLSILNIKLIGEGLVDDDADFVWTTG